MLPARRIIAMSLAGLLLAGCNLGTAPSIPTTPKRTAAPKPDRPGAPTPNPTGLASLAPGTGSPAPLVAGVVHLTGKVKLLSDKGAALISNNGGAIIANNGGGIIANNGGGMISDGAGNVVANNGAGYRLRQAPAAESLLADADITFVDAAGQPITGPDGQPLRTTTDRTGRYQLRTALPAGNMVLKVKLWNGGELAAILAGGADRATTLDVDTASSLGSAFVLEKLVKGDQATLDKLPASEAARLQREMEASRALLAAPPSYQPGSLASAAADLRKKAPAVDAALKTIEALLLGQAKLGDGTPATGVPLNRPYGVIAAPDGSLLIAESGMGRLRRVTPDGLMSTYADGGRGVVRRNFVGARDLLRLPDGTVYVTCTAERAVYKITPGDVAEKVFTGDAAIGFAPYAVAVGPDGTLSIGGKRYHPDNGLRGPHWVTVAPDGTARAMPTVGSGGNGMVNAILPAPQGGVLMLRCIDAPNAGAVYHVPAAGEPTVVVDGLSLGEESDMQRGADGTLYVSEGVPKRLLAIAPDGTRRVLAGEGAPADAAKIVEPGSLGLGPDGTLYVSDIGTARVFARDPKGAWRAVAGVDTDAPIVDGNAIPLNSPSALAFDAQGRLLIAENGRHRIVRYAGGRLEAIAGAAEGYKGDGGPAKDAHFSGLTGIATRGDEIFVVDSINGRLRHIDAAGIVTTLAGTDQYPIAAEKPSYAAAELNLRNSLGVAIGPDDRPYFTNTKYDQILRLGAPDRVDVVMGVRPGGGPSPMTDALNDVLTDGEPASKAKLRTPTGLAFDAAGDLYVADAGHLQIRKITGLATSEPKVEAFAGRGPATFASILGDPGAAGRDGDRREIDLVVPGGLCFDPKGNMYVGEMGTRRLEFLSDIAGAGFDASTLPPIAPRIRKIAPDGRVTTIAGPGGKFFTDPDAEDALVMPTIIAYAPDGRLVIADPGANLVRILPAGSF